MTWADFSVTAAALAGAVSGVLGLGAPRLIRSLREPEPVDPPARKEAYVVMAALPHLAAGVAVTSAVLGLLVGGVLGWSPAWGLWAVLIPLGVTLSVVDWRTKLLPRQVVLPATSGALVYLLVVAGVTQDTGALTRAVIVALIYRSWLWLQWAIAPGLMGFGDVRLAALLGLALGVVGVGHWVLGYFAATVLGAVLNRPLVWVGLREKSKTVPFGPFLVAGAVLGVLLGGPVDEWVRTSYGL